MLGIPTDTVHATTTSEVTTARHGPPIRHAESPACSVIFNPSTARNPFKPHAAVVPDPLGGNSEWFDSRNLDPKARHRMSGTIGHAKGYCSSHHDLASTNITCSLLSIAYGFIARTPTATAAFGILILPTSLLGVS